MRESFLIFVAPLTDSNLSSTKTITPLCKRVPGDLSGLIIVLLIHLVTGAGYTQPPYKFKTRYGLADLEKTPNPPEYDQLHHWIAHPDVQDYADHTPGKDQLQEKQATAEVDVFFIYPTIYSGKQKKEHPWFADVNDAKLRKEIGKSTIRNQATVFNGAARIYAPLYRQAHLGVFYQNDLELQVEALEYAYLDVKKAFQCYLTHWNDGRPIIIAAHSQGTRHAVNLLT